MRAPDNFLLDSILRVTFWIPGVWLLVLAVFYETPAYADASQGGGGEIRRIIWTGEPIKIELAVNQERRLTFPADIFVEYNKATDPALARIRIQVIGSTAYLKASQAVPSSRLIIGEVSTQKRYLLDIKAVKTGNQYPRVVVEDGATAYAPGSATVFPGSLPAVQGSRNAGYVGLIRFAAKELYAPDRLRGTDKTITRTAVTNKRVHHLLRGHVADTRPVAAWKSGELYVTALDVKNTSSHPLLIDPRDVRGAWRAVTFQHNRLEAKGSHGDTTAMYLVSDLPFAQAIQGYAVRVGGMQR